MSPTQQHNSSRRNFGKQVGSALFAQAIGVPTSASGSAVRTVVADVGKTVATGVGANVGGVVLSGLKQKLLQHFGAISSPLVKILELKPFDFMGYKFHPHQILRKEILRDENDQIGFLVFEYLREWSIFRKFKGVTFAEIMNTQDLGEVASIFGSGDFFGKRLKDILSIGSSDPRGKILEFMDVLGLKESDDVKLVYEKIREAVVFYIEDLLSNLHLREKQRSGYSDRNVFSYVKNCLDHFEFKITDPLYVRVLAAESKCEAEDKEAEAKENTESRDRWESEKRLEMRDLTVDYIRNSGNLWEFRFSYTAKYDTIKNKQREVFPTFTKMDLLKILQSPTFDKFNHEYGLPTTLAQGISYLEVEPTGVIASKNYGENYMVTTNDPRVAYFLIQQDKKLHPGNNKFRIEMLGPEHPTYKDNSNSLHQQSGHWKSRLPKVLTNSVPPNLRI